MGLGYPGGPELNRLAEKHLTTLGMKEPVYHPKLGRSRVALPRPRPGNRWDDNLDFSFSGLKTAVKLIVQETGLPEENYPELALGLHEAVGEVFVRKLDVALEQYPVRSLWLTGGVACNSLLRSWLRAWCVDRNLSFLVAPPRLCTDNAAMIGYAALLRLHADALGIEPIEVEATSEVRSYN
jgi:N6-L-threonylcarbamoyladenine synthase